MKFYCNPTTNGGLGGNESDFAHIRRFAPVNPKSANNPYHYLCDTALNLFKHYEPLYASDLIFLGDQEYRQMLGLSRGDYGISVTAENIDLYLDNSYSLLLSLCNKIAPGLGLDPLKQSIIVKDEFVLYRMLLLKQLASMSLAENKEISTEIKFKIRRFIKNRFNLETEVIFDDLANQRFLLNNAVKTSQSYRNNDQFTVTDVALDNITQAITLDVAYNSINFKLIDVLDYYLDDFLHHRDGQPAKVFAYGSSEQELNPQGTKQFARLIIQYCENTSSFLNKSQQIKPLTATNILDCYKYNISTQVYQTQLRIIKNIKELHKHHHSQETTQQIDLLLNSFQELSEFAKVHCFPLKGTSSINKLFHLVRTTRYKSDNSKGWIIHVDSVDSLIYLMNTVSEHIQISINKNRSPALFFHHKALSPNIDEAQSMVQLRL
ncbi:hypothetical protein [uncultured Legionella sp.]|uniref:hypothetical protein n=1 Tax=uncultured Legionella sp. TaxID=210934 RepID=UPI00260B4E9A|nr:hypothetical protein [uncultured Legionella sp.]